MGRRRRLTMWLAVALASVLGGLVIAGPASAAPAWDSGPAAKSSDTMVLKTTRQSQRGGATLAVEEYIACTVNARNPYALGSSVISEASVSCSDQNGFPAVVDNIYIYVELYGDNGTAFITSGESSRPFTTSHSQMAEPPPCIPDIFGTAAYVEVTFPLDYYPRVAGGWFTSDLVRLTC
jgi:hypothetical protein